MNGSLSLDALRFPRVHQKSASKNDAKANVFVVPWHLRLPDRGSCTVRRQFFARGVVQLVMMEALAVEAGWEARATAGAGCCAAITLRLVLAILRVQKLLCLQPL
jgi:hypothetical protein